MAADATAALIAAGLSHHTAPVQVRERLALDEAGVRAELVYLREAGLIREAMLLSTCNRVELYAVPEPRALDRLRDHLVRRRFAGESLERYFYWHQGREAVRHLFRVAASLDSLVVGEPQILGQVKEAVRVAGTAGALGTVLNRLTQRTLWVAKHVRTHTDIGRHNVGVGNAGVFLAEQIFSSLKGRRALLIGTGEMGRQVARAMVGAGILELLVANRTFSTAVEVAQEHGGTPIPFERVDDYLERVDIVIVATGAARPILHAEQVRRALRVRRYQPLFLVDLSVPRNVDPEIDRMDHAYLFNVDDLTQVTERGRVARESASVRAEALVAEEAERFTRRLADLAVHDAIGELVRKVEGLRQLELQRSQRLVDALDGDQRDALDAMTRAFAKRVLHGPLMALREASRDGDVDRMEALLGAWAVGLGAEEGDDGG